MKASNNILSKLPDYFLSQLLSFSFVLALTTSLGFDYPFLNIWLLILAATTAFAIAFTNRRTLIVSGALVGLGLLVSAYFVIFRIGCEKLSVFLDDYFYWLSYFIENGGNTDRLYQLITVAALCIAISLLVYTLTVKRFLFYILLVIGSALFTIQWSYTLSVTMLPFYMFLPAILMLYFKHVHKKKSAAAPNDYIQTGYFTLWTIPVCLIAILIAASFHTSEKPLEWKWLDTKINSVYNYINKKFDYEAFDYFSVSSSGFGSKDNVLGGRVRLDKTSVLRVESPRNVYLKGIARDTYTGTKWINSNPENQNIGTDYSSLYEDTDEMISGMRLLTPDTDYLNKLFYKDKVDITFQNLKTKSLFIPSKTMVFSPPGNSGAAMTDSNGSLSVADRLTKGYKYSVELYNPKIGSADFIKAMKESKPGLYNETLDNLQNFNKLTRVENSTDQKSDVNTKVYTIRLIDYKEIEKLKTLSDRAAGIEAKYKQLPQNLPQRVRDLAVSVTNSSDNRYDKVKAIEKYLSSNFPYKLDVKTTPRNRDFVDFFLFDLKQGYCTYYASAMAILARCADIPARYVEGYLLPPKPVEDGSKTYIVTNMQAHAWVEVYFEGYGWLPFEPTSPFRSNFYSDASFTSSISGEYNAAYQDYMDMIRKYSQGGYNSDGVGLIPVEEEKKTNYLLISLIAAGALILIFLTVLFTNLFRSKLRLFKILSLPPRDCILKLYEYFIRILTLQGLALQGGETPFLYSQRIDKTLFFDPVKFLAVTEIFVKCRYGVYNSDEKEKQLISDFSRSFLNETRNNIGKFKFFVLKCILGKI